MTTVIQIIITETLGLGCHEECLLVGDEGDGNDVDFLQDLDTILYHGSVSCAANRSLQRQISNCRRCFAEKYIFRFLIVFTIRLDHFLLLDVH